MSKLPQSGCPLRRGEKRMAKDELTDHPNTKYDREYVVKLTFEEACLLWTEKCAVWIPAIGTIKQKLDYICNYIDTFEGNYQELIRSGLLEDIVEMVPECWERFLAFLDDSDSWDIDAYKIERWYGEEAEAEGRIGDAEQHAYQAEKNDGTADQLEDVVGKQEEDQEIDHSYRNDKNFYIPVPCLFTRAEMSVLCNMASHVEGFELGELGVWPPALSLPLSQIMRDRDAGRAKRAWDMVVGLGYDEDGNLPTFEVMTEDMLNLSADVHILTIEQ